MAYLRISAAVLVLLLPSAFRPLSAQTCTTQSRLQPADRDSLAAAALDVAGKIQRNDISGLKVLTVPEFTTDFSGMSNLATDTASHVRGAALAVEQLYVLDGTQLKSATGSDPAQFFCSLSGTDATVDFAIPGMTAGRYGFAIVEARATGTPSWRIPMLLRQEGARWLLAGFYPRPTEAAGHDGLWYWREARRLSSAKELWNAWLYYEEASALLRPTNFVSTSHFEKLEDEQRQATPPQLSGGISTDVPLVLRGADGTEFRITRLAPDNSLGRPRLDVLMQLDAPTGSDSAALQHQAEAAAGALLGAYPELKKQFSGVYVALRNNGRIIFTQERPIA